MNFTKKCCHTGQNYLLQITLLLKIKLMPEQKLRRFESRLSAESPLFVTCVVGREHKLYSEYFLRFCKTAMHVGSPESFMSQIIRQAQCLHVTKLLLWLTQVRSTQNNIS